MSVNYGGKERAFYRRLSEGFLFIQDDKTLSVKGADAEYTSATPCGHGVYFAFVVPKDSLKKDASGVVSVNAETLHASKFRASFVRDAEGLEWLCFDKRPTPTPSLLDKLPPVPTMTPPEPPTPSTTQRPRTRR